MAAEGNETLASGRFVLSCVGSASRTVNVDAALMFGAKGDFSKTYTQHDAKDVACKTPPMMQVMLQGTYTLDGPSTCGGTCGEVSECIEGGKQKKGWVGR
jgi:hypothetical protein